MRWQHHSVKQSSKGWKTALIVCMVVVGLFAGTAGAAVWYYHRSLGPLQANGSSKEITIPTGATVAQIADQLEKEQLIRNAWAFNYYVKLKHGEQYLMAGTYVFSPSQSVPSIISQLTHGKVATKLVVILPGQRIDQIRRSLIDQGFRESEVDAALQPAQYENLAILADKPSGASLEGYLYPESFERSTSTTATDIIKQSLSQMDRHLTTAIKQGFADQGLTTYQGLIVASIVEKEVVPEWLQKALDQAKSENAILAAELSAKQSSGDRRDDIAMRVDFFTARITSFVRDMSALGYLGQEFARTSPQAQKKYAAAINALEKLCSDLRDVAIIPRECDVIEIEAKEVS